MSSSGDGSTNNNKSTNILVGNRGKKDLSKILRSTSDPFATIRNLQESQSLQAQLSRAFGTTPPRTTTITRNNKNDNNNNVEPLDTNSVMVFLSHLGVTAYEVHKRVAEALRSQLEGEIRKQTGRNNKEGLLNLLRSCWFYSTTIPELRPVLWAVLRQLGEDTPVAVLERLGERDKDGKSLKYAEIWHPLPPLLKRLVWEADWSKHVPDDDDGTNSKPDNKFLDSVQKSLFGQQLAPVMERYMDHPKLSEMANRPFVSTSRERQLRTNLRREVSANNKDLLGVAKAVVDMKTLLSGGDTVAYRPKLLYAACSILMAHHGSSKKSAESILGGQSFLHCTLLSDLLLSGPLPKAYQPLKALARVLDEAVRNGELLDSHVRQAQVNLRQMFPFEPNELTGASSSTNKKKDNDEDDDDDDDETKSKKTTTTSEQARLLRKIIAAGLKAMKEADPQSLFLNPVTDDIAPGYSKVIDKPICIKQMEKNKYRSLQEWDRDVKLMYTNCITYNVGNAGQWFRGEARRQKKVFSEDILPQAKRLYQEETAKHKPPPTPKKANTIKVDKNDKGKNKREAEEEAVEPLAGGVSSNKKRKKDGGTEQQQQQPQYIPSLPALASMLLCDPFVVRLLLDRIIRSLRIDTRKGATIPLSHKTVPSLLQLLLMAQLSGPLCAVKGKQYQVPDAGFEIPQEENNPALFIPYKCLREFTPLVLKLLLEADLDRRLAGELSSAVSTSSSSTMKPNEGRSTVESTAKAWRGTTQLTVLRAMVEGALVHVCQPGNSYESSLSISFPKFSIALQEFKLWEEGPFFQSLLIAIMKHKSKLGKKNRDVIIKCWLFDWIQRGSSSSSSASKKGAMLSAAHKYLVMLLAEWGNMGNILLPRDKLMELSLEVIQTVNETESRVKRKFKAMWNDKDDFGPIREQYERILKVLPDEKVKAWKEQAHIVDEKDDDGDVVMEKKD